MSPLPFDMELIRTLAEVRTEPLTTFFQLCTFMGNVEGYVLIVALVFVAFDKGLAYRLAVVTLVTMALNHVLKMLVGNPRPFVVDGTWMDSWAVAPERAAELATEFSTPSGHAMAGAAFCLYLRAHVRSRAGRAACIAMILLTGLSRPYLGVHYMEDVLSGWVIGGAIALAALRWRGRIASRWQALGHAGQIGATAAASALVWAVTQVLDDETGGEPLAYLGYTGLLMGLVVAFPVEQRRVGFDPRRGSVGAKALRYGAAVGAVLGTLIGLDHLFAAVARDASAAGSLLR